MSSSRRALMMPCVVLCCGLIVGCGGEKNKSQAVPKRSETPKAEVVSVAPTAAPAPRTEYTTPTLPLDAAIEPPVQSSSQGFRHNDDRVIQNAERLSGSKIQKFESKRLILYSDADPKLAARLPAMADLLFESLTKYYGKLPANQAGTDFQVTGYLMVDQKSFRKFGLLTDRVPAFENGRHLGYEFWVNAQTTDYYSRHLTFHEFTHCFMTCVTGSRNCAPTWYMEGMAELFGTHRLTGDRVEFGVMPENKRDYEGLGRITFLNKAAAENNIMTLNDVMRLPGAEPTLYSWSWAACWFLTQHPEFGPKLRKMGTHITAAQFEQELSEAVGHDRKQLDARWSDFIGQLCDGYDLPRAALSVRSTRDLAAGESITIDVAADKGWQSSGIVLTQNSEYTVRATGRFQVNDQPKPWISEADGVSIRYVRGHRLGCLQGAVYRSDDRTSLSQVMKIGSEAELKGERGTLYLRINDTMNSLANNSGHVSVAISRVR